VVPPRLGVRARDDVGVVVGVALVVEGGPAILYRLGCTMRLGERVLHLPLLAASCALLTLQICGEEERLAGEF